MFKDLKDRCQGNINACGKYQNERVLQESKKDALLKEYRELVEAVRNDYRQRTMDSAGNAILLWCEACNEINLWTYWQGIGNLNSKILLVGQDWGCAFNNNFANFKERIVAMNTGDFSMDYIEETKFTTDKNLIELFDVLGYDLREKSTDLFFTNLILGYRRKRSTGVLRKESFLKDVVYLECLVKIIKPDVIICLGKDTYEVAASELSKKKVHINKFYQTLEDGDNYITFELSGKTMRIYAVAHCGSYGVMNRKKYASNSVDTKSGLDLQKEDWMKIKEYLEEVNCKGI